MQKRQQPQMPVQPQGEQVQNPGFQYSQPAQPQAPQPQPMQYQVPQASGQYQQPQQPYGYAQPVGSAPSAYYVSDQDKTLRLIAFIFNIISLITLCWLIPMCVISWGIYKGTKANTVAFGVCTLIFSSLVAGILLLISAKDR